MICKNEEREVSGIRYRLVRSERRTMSLQVDEVGDVVVRSPMRLPSDRADSFVREKAAWILQKQELIDEHKEYRLLELHDETEIPYLGSMILLKLCNVPIPILWHGKLLMPRRGDLRRSFLLWREQQAKLILEPRIEAYCQKMSLFPHQIKLSEASTSWGSMSQSGAMKINAAMIHYTEREIDYVIVHELCHMKHMNHSPDFYREMEKWISNPKAIQKELRSKGIPQIVS